MAVFDFCPERQVPEMLPPEAGAATSMNGWEFTQRPSIPFRRKFKVTLYGLRWYLTAGGLFDATTAPTFNAKRLEEFYQSHERWKEFTWTHQHIGVLTCKFASSVAVPAGLPNSGGKMGPLEVILIESNPGY